MIVSDFMTRRVITIAPDSSVVEAAKLMMEHKVSGLPVIDAARHVVGIVSEHDLLRRRESGKGKQSHWLRLMIERTGLTDEFSSIPRTKSQRGYDGKSDNYRSHLTARRSVPPDRGTRHQATAGCSQW